MSEAFVKAMGAILSERAYQDDKWGDNLDKTNTLDDYIQYMKNYLNALESCDVEENKLHGIRKVAAIGVKAMEVFGAPQREGHEFNTNYSKIESHEVPKGTLDALMDDGCPHEGLTESEFEKAEPLSPEALDALVQDGQAVKEIERGVWYRVNESQRVYHYDDEHEDGVKHIFSDIRAFAVMPSGGHRLIDAYGTGYYVQPGWNVLAIPDLETV